MIVMHMGSGIDVALQGAKKVARLTPTFSSPPNGFANFAGRHEPYVTVVLMHATKNQ
jgi:hypothetical protein